MRFLPSRQPIRDLSPRPSGYPDKARRSHAKSLSHPVSVTMTVAHIVRYLSSQTSSMRQPLYMLLVIRVSPFTQGSPQEAPAG